jgi:dTDP-4-dehydrorhamnose reductase
MRVLVTGARGQLGTDVCATLSASGDEVIGVDLPELDVSDRTLIVGAVGSVRPDVVLHLAAWTAVDAQEADPGEALRVNGLAVRWVAEACRRFDSHLVHVSTDYVFDGTKPEPYHEWDVPNPVSSYGRSKLAGEREARNGSGGAATIARISWVCGEHGGNMVKTILRLAEGDGTLRFVDDQRGHPTFCSDLAPMLRRLAVDRVPGVVHVTNQGAVSWCEFAREVLLAAGGDPGRVEPITTADLVPPRPAPRPANSVLTNSVLTSLGWPLMRDFREPLRELVAKLRP